MSTPTAESGDTREAGRRAELVEAAYLWDMADQVPGDLAERLGLAGLRVGGGVVRVAANDPTGGFWNRCIGLGQTEPVTAQVLDEAIAFARDHDAPVMVFQVPDQVEGWDELATERGLMGSATWVKFMGPTPAIAEAPTDLRIERIDPHDADQTREFARVQVDAFEMPRGLMEEWCADLAGRPDWPAFAAYDGDRMVAIAQLYVHGDTGHLVGAGTLPEARGRGAQLALMKARVDEAVAQGCRWIGSETGAESPESPNPSLHNMRRIGLVELYERRNWIWRA